MGCPEGHPRGCPLNPPEQVCVSLEKLAFLSPPSSPIPFPSAMLTMGVLGSPSNCRGAHRKGSVEPPAALALGKVQFLAS